MQVFSFFLMLYHHWLIQLSLECVSTLPAPYIQLVSSPFLSILSLTALVQHLTSPQGFSGRGFDMSMSWIWKDSFVLLFPSSTHDHANPLNNLINGISIPYLLHFEYPLHTAKITFLRCLPQKCWMVPECLQPVIQRLGVVTDTF